MVDNALRTRVLEATRGIWGSLEGIGYDIGSDLGSINLDPIGKSVYYDMTMFLSSPVINSGDTYKRVYGQMSEELKPRRFRRHTGGVKLTEEEALHMSNADITAQVTQLASREERMIQARLNRDAVGFLDNSGAGQSLISIFGKQATSGSSAVLPADCNSTPGTALSCNTINFSGAGLTERNLESTLGAAIRGIGTKVLDTDTEEAIIRMDGTDQFTWYCHPNAFHIYNTAHDLLDSGEHDTRTYVQAALQDYKCKIIPTLYIDTYNGASDQTNTNIIVGNPKTNFFKVNVNGEGASWEPWEYVFDGETKCVVKSYKAGVGFAAKPFVAQNSTQYYKSLFIFTTTPNGA